VISEKTIVDSSILIGAFVTVITIVLSVIAFYLKDKKHKKLSSVILVGLGYVITITIWSMFEDVFYSQLFFFMHTSYFVLVTIINLKENDNYLKSVALSTYGLFVVVSFVVLIIISEGEALEGVGYFGDTSNKKNQIKS
jgi:multisubunit Na+/H+ antiporter MnhB subunit